MLDSINVLSRFVASLTVKYGTTDLVSLMKWEQDFMQFSVVGSHVLLEPTHLVSWVGGEGGDVGFGFIATGSIVGDTVILCRWLLSTAPMVWITINRFQVTAVGHDSVDLGWDTSKVGYITAYRLKICVSGDFCSSGKWTLNNKCSPLCTRKDDGNPSCGDDPAGECTASPRTLVRRVSSTQIAL